MVGIFNIGRLAVATAVLACAFAGQAVAQTTITPTVAYPGTVSGVQVIEERGLNEPVPGAIDVATLNLQEALDLAAANNARWLSNCPGQGSPPWSAVGNSVRSDGLPRGTFICSFGGFSGNNSVYTAYAERRVFAVLVGSLIDNTDGTLGLVELRGLPLGGSPFTTEAGNLAVATANLLRGARARDGRRYFAGLAIQTGGGPVVITDRVLNQALTGSDTLIFLVDTIGPNFVIAGTQINCPESTSTVGCDGGVQVELPSNTSNINVQVIQTLYITTTVERTLTGGTTFYDVELTPLPSGAVHAAFANAGFLVSDRFLRRLTDGPADAALGRGAVWGEAWTSQASFDAEGVLGATDIDSHGFAGGVVVRPAEHWTLGLAGEYGETELSIDDALTPEAGEASHLKLGAHAGFARGRFHANAAAMVGAFDIDTMGFSVLGEARANYDATISGASVEAGYDFPAGALTLTPHVGASVLSWERDGFSETGGPAPLTLAAEDESQTRVWAGLNARWTPDMGEGRLDVNAYVRAVSISGDTISHVTTFDPQLPGEAFVVAGPDFGDNAAEFGAALDYRLGERTRIEAAYDGRAGDNFDEHAGRLTLRVAF